MSVNTATVDEQKRYKMQRLEEFRAYHANLINNLGISKTDFNIKKPFFDKYGRQVVGIFASEFRKEKGFYFEMVTRDLDPHDEQRTVYRIPNNPHYETEYESNEIGSFLIPIEELRVVNAASVAISGPSAVVDRPQGVKPLVQVFKSGPTTPTEDAPYGEMTIRDYYAIHTGNPVSQKQWLNDLIKFNK